MFQGYVLLGIVSHLRELASYHRSYLLDAAIRIERTWQSSLRSAYFEGAFPLIVCQTATAAAREGTHNRGKSNTSVKTVVSTIRRRFKVKSH